jgi:hypothetical protein
MDRRLRLAAPQRLRRARTRAGRSGAERTEPGQHVGPPTIEMRLLLAQDQGDAVRHGHPHLDRRNAGSEHGHDLRRNDAQVALVRLLEESEAAVQQPEPQTIVIAQP